MQGNSAQGNYIIITITNNTTFNYLISIYNNYNYIFLNNENNNWILIIIGWFPD